MTDVTGAIVYGYLHDPKDRQQWIVDEEAASIVKRVFRSIIEGKSMSQIAAELTAEKVLTPATHWEKIGAGMRKPHNADPYKCSSGFCQERHANRPGLYRRR